VFTSHNLSSQIALTIPLPVHKQIAQKKEGLPFKSL
jgi:hypothetical protein